jgi:hypothetical protein
LVNLTLIIFGNNWKTSTMSCLQRKLIPLLKEKNLTCEYIKSFAYETHPICYTQKEYSVCSFSNPIDLIKILLIIDVKDILSLMLNFK